MTLSIIKVSPVSALSTSALLDRVWQHWNIDMFADTYSFVSDYSRVSRRSWNAQRFENWLYQQGATVCRVNKKCHIEFFSSEDAVVFRLKYQ